MASPDEYDAVEAAFLETIHDPEHHKQMTVGERVALELFGIDIAKARDEQRCVPPPIGCGQPATTFMDELSKKEYSISGLCQNCQDEIFGGQS